MATPVAVGGGDLPYGTIGGEPAVPGGPGGFVLPPVSASGGTAGSPSRVGFIRRALQQAGRKDRLKWAQSIDVAADEENVDPVVLAVVVAAQPGTLSAATIRSAAQALARAFYRTGTVQGAWETLGGQGKIGRFIPKGYEANFGDPINDTVEAGGGSGGGGGRTRQPKLTPEQQVQLSVYKSTLREELTNPWVVLRDGKVTFVSNTKRPGTPPKGSLGIRHDQFMSAFQSLTETFQVFIGRKPTAKEVATIVKKGWSEFQLKRWLSKQKGFEASTIFKSSASEYTGVARDILGPSIWNSVPAPQRKELLRQAIVQGWSQATFAEKLRGLPSYLQGNEFKQTEAGLSGVYQQIFGYPTAGAVTTIREAALARWTPDQFAGYLRNTPSYASSPEYQTKALGVLDALGMIAGSVGPALVPGTPPPGPPREGFGQVPNSPRVEGAPSAPTSPLAGLTPGFA